MKKTTVKVIASKPISVSVTKGKKPKVKLKPNRMA